MFSPYNSIIIYGVKTIDFQGSNVCKMSQRYGLQRKLAKYRKGVNHNEHTIENFTKSEKSIANLRWSLSLCDILQTSLPWKCNCFTKLKNNIFIIKIYENIIKIVLTY